MVYNSYLKPRSRDGYEADHIIPLYFAFRELKHDGLWPHILWFWSSANIQYLTPSDHSKKSAIEARERANFRLKQDGKQSEMLF